jgi:diaminopimelate epimerase
MGRLILTKLQSNGNDFLLADTARTGQMDWSLLAKTICSRHYGVGSDGLIVLEGKGSAIPKYRMWNPDGSEDFCVNGLQCVAVYMGMLGLCREEGQDIESVAGICNVSAAIDCLTHCGDVSIYLRPPNCDSQSIPISLAKPRSPAIDIWINVAGRDVCINAVSTGVTHVVIFVDQEPTSQEFLHLSPAIETSALFPDRTCVMWTTVVDRKTIALRIWERGVGETLACGSGACAAAYVAYLTNRTDDEVCVKSRGGQVAVAILPNGSIRLVGRANLVCDMDIDFYL